MTIMITMMGMTIVTMTHPKRPLPSWSSSSSAQHGKALCCTLIIWMIIVLDFDNLDDNLNDYWDDNLDDNCVAV